MGAAGLKPTGDAAELAVVVAPGLDEIEPGLSKRRRERVVLLAAELEEQRTPVVEKAGGGVDSTSDHIEAVRPAIKGAARFVALNIRWQQPQLVGRDVGSHCAHDVEPVLAAQRRGKIADKDRHTIGPRAGGCPRIEVQADDGRGGDLGHEVNSDRAGAGAQVERGAALR